MKHPLIPYHHTGLVKLLELKDPIMRVKTELIQYNKFNQKPDKLSTKTIENFVSIFCEHELADTDYIAVQQDAVGYKSLSDYISKNNLSLAYIIKCLTYFIWTDRIIEGYLINRVKDNSLSILLNQLKDALDGSLTSIA